MAVPRKYPDELPEAGDPTRGRRPEGQRTRRRGPALARIGGQLGINPETLRNWVTQAEIDAGSRLGTAWPHEPHELRLGRRRTGPLVARRDRRRIGAAGNGDRPLKLGGRCELRPPCTVSRVAVRSDRDVRVDAQSCRHRTR